MQINQNLIRYASIVDQAFEFIFEVAEGRTILARWWVHPTIAVRMSRSMES
jgi:hypothetical protein